MNKEHVKILKSGVIKWSAWRKENPSIKPDLSGADLRWADLSDADLRWAYLSEADLSEADLRWSNLQGADLRCANLQGANLDFSAWPLRCGGLNLKIDDAIFGQLLYHALMQDVSQCSVEVQAAVIHLRQKYGHLCEALVERHNLPRP